MLFPQIGLICFISGYILACVGPSNICILLGNLFVAFLFSFLGDSVVILAFLHERDCVFLPSLVSWVFYGPDPCCLLEFTFLMSEVFLSRQ